MASSQRVPERVAVSPVTGSRMRTTFSQTVQASPSTRGERVREVTLSGVLSRRSSGSARTSTRRPGATQLPGSSA